MRGKWKAFMTGALAAALTAVPSVVLASEEAHGGGEAANTIHDPRVGFNHLWHELMIDLWVIGVFFGGLLLYFMFRYKATSPNQVGDAPKLSTAQSLGWAMIPAFVFMADDFYLAANGWVLFNWQRRVPADAMEVKVTGSQWAWDFDYGDGVTDSVLRVPQGKPVVLRMHSEDVIHSFFIPKHRIKEDVLPGRVNYLWFYPDEVTKTVATCTEFCGAGHAEMFTDIITLKPEEFQAWLNEQKGVAAPVAADAAAEAPAADAAAAEAPAADAAPAAPADAAAPAAEAPAAPAAH